MILPLKLQYYLHWRKIWEGKHSNSHVWQASAMKWSLVFSLCAFPSGLDSEQHAHSLYSVGRDQLLSSLFSLEQSCICPCLNMGTKTSVHGYALFHIIHSHNKKWKKAPMKLCSVWSTGCSPSNNTVPCLGNYQYLTSQEPKEHDYPCFGQEVRLETTRSPFQYKFACDFHPQHSCDQ